MRLVLYRRSAWLLAAGLGLAILSGCNRGGPEQGSLNEGTSTPEEVAPAPPEPVNLAPAAAPVNSAAPADRIVEPNLTRDEQVRDDAEATGMTARTHDGLTDGTASQPVEAAADSSGRRGDPLEAPADTTAQSGNAAQTQGER